MRKILVIFSLRSSTILFGREIFIGLTALRLLYTSFLYGRYLVFLYLLLKWKKEKTKCTQWSVSYVRVIFFFGLIKAFRLLLYLIVPRLNWKREKIRDETLGEYSYSYLPIRKPFRYDTSITTFILLLLTIRATFSQVQWEPFEVKLRNVNGLSDKWSKENVYRTHRWLYLRIWCYYLHLDQNEVFGLDL